LMKTEPEISIFIPIYKESDILKSLLTRLLNEPYDEKEIFVIIDEPTERSIDLSRRMKGDVRFILNGERLGKANALNRAVKQSIGEILLFLDSDIQIPKSSFLEAVSVEMETSEILGIKNNVLCDSFISRITSYEFLSFNYAFWLFSHFLSRCLGVHGAAFAIRRNTFQSLGGFRSVVAEDLDLGTRSFLNDIKYKYNYNIEVQNRVPSSWKTWFEQRKRWGLGVALWFREYYREVLSSFRKHPKILIPSLFILFPSIIVFSINVMIPDHIYLKLLSIILLFISTKQLFLLPPILLTSVGLTLIKSFLTVFCGFAAYAIIFYFFARKLKYNYNLLDFLFFYFIYNPLWFLFVIASIIGLMIWPRKIDIDWKT